MDFAGTGKATAEATWPAIFQAMCDTRSGLDKLLVETHSMRTDNAVIFGRVSDTLDRLDAALLEPMMAKGKGAGIEVRAISDHRFIDSIYFRDPNGYVIELTAKRPSHDREMDPATNGARSKLDQWQVAKRERATRPS